jgi:hypothetical protein
MSLLQETKLHTKRLLYLDKSPALYIGNIFLQTPHQKKSLLSLPNR